MVCTRLKKITENPKYRYGVLKAKMVTGIEVHRVKQFAKTFSHSSIASSPFLLKPYEFLSVSFACFPVHHLETNILNLTGSMSSRVSPILIQFGAMILCL